MSGDAASVGASANSLGALGTSLLALLLVIGLILLLAWLLRRLPGFAGQRAHGQLRIVASLAVGMRERIVVVAVGDTQLVVGITADSIRLLHRLETPLTEPTAVDFRQLLQGLGKSS